MKIRKTRLISIVSNPIKVLVVVVVIAVIDFVNKKLVQKNLGPKKSTYKKL